MSATFVIDRHTGIVAGVRQVLSPHQDERPAGVEPDLLVVHGISLPPGEYGGPWIERLFCGNLPVEAHAYFVEIQALRVSAHLLVRRSGEILQFVPLTMRAWHAGASSFQGRAACNDYSIGIELEGVDSAPYDERQYAALVTLTKSLREAYPAIEPQRVVGHSDVAPGRKTDPGPAFDWRRLRNTLV
jgi:AmpD protein